MVRPRRQGVEPGVREPVERLPEAIVPSAPRTGVLTNLAPEEQAEVKEEQTKELEVRRLAQLFLERYGSFTNQGNYENVSDLYPLMSSAMRKKSDAYVREQKSLHPLDLGYYGITTKALSSSVTFSGANRSSVEISTQRQESAGVSSARVIYQTAKVGLVRIGTEWKVDSVEWGAVENR